MTSAIVGKMAELLTLVALVAPQLLQEALAHYAPLLVPEVVTAANLRILTCLLADVAVGGLDSLLVHTAGHGFVR